MKTYQKTSLSIERRIDALLAELTVEEKLGFIDYRNAGVPRLGIPPYSWWNEALHGLARSGTATRAVGNAVIRVADREASL